MPEGKTGIQCHQKLLMSRCHALFEVISFYVEKCNRKIDSEFNKKRNKMYVT